MYVLQMVFITILIMHKSFFVFLQSSGTILEYLQLCSNGILMEFKNGSHGLASHELLRNRVRALPLLHRNGCFQSIFPKRCPGCVGLNLVCAAEVLCDPTLIHEVIKTLVGGQRGCPYSINEIFSFQMLSKRYYQRRNDRYPFMGNCLDFGLFNSHTSSQANEKFLQDMNALGKLLCEGEGSSKS